MTTTLQDLKPSQIKPHKRNVRRDVGDVVELAASITAKGLLEPLIVAPSGTGKFPTFVLIAGHRRLEAAKVAKLKSVPCLVRDDLVDDAAQLEAMLVENLQRTDLSPVEEADAYQQLLTFPGYTQAKLAETTGRAIATVKARLKLAKLGDTTREKVHTGQISLSEAAALTDFADDPAASRRIESAVGTSQFPYVLQREKDSRARARKVDQLTRQLKTNGVRVIASPSWDERRKMRQLDGADEIGQHRACPGFAAYLNADQWTPVSAIAPKYVCDQPQLHVDDAGEDGADPDAAERQREHAELKAALERDAEIRRAWLRDHVLGDPSDGLGLDVLRQYVHARFRSIYLQAWVYELLGIAKDDKKALAERIDHLDWRQLAILLDFERNDHAEAALLHGHGWENLSYNQSEKDWRARLTGLYGYTWTEHEQQMLDQAAAAAEAGQVDDDEDLDDELGDVDEISDADS